VMLNKAIVDLPLGEDPLNLTFPLREG
jgi:hypothetical protein